MLSVPALRQVWLSQDIIRLAVIADPSSHQQGLFIINLGCHSGLCDSAKKVGVYRHLQNGDTTERSKKLKDHHKAGKIIINPPTLFEECEFG